MLMANVGKEILDRICMMILGTNGWLEWLISEHGVADRDGALIDGSGRIRSRCDQVTTLLP